MRAQKQKKQSRTKEREKSGESGANLRDQETEKKNNNERTKDGQKLTAGNGLHSTTPRAHNSISIYSTIIDNVAKWAQFPRDSS